MYEFIDLSHTIEENMPLYPGMPPPTLKECATINGDGYRESVLNLSTHTGTHIDVEAHIFHHGKVIDEYMIDQFYGTARLINCSGNQVITDGQLRQRVEEIDLPEFLLLYTGWERYWGQNEYYSNYPVLSTSAAKFLSKLPLKGIGIDSISFDAFDNSKLTNHKILLKQEMILVENLQGLKKIPNKEFTFACFPLKLRNGDSSPVRACAILNK